ncbi:MAG: hypothetical protein IPF44_00980 [Betaproteobacteria bacterium]|nr:hypothetical protein [Betaproteobacteria bacterium]
MELKELLALNEPSVEQYGEMEKQLLSIARAASAEITRLDAEGLARGADRLLGHDDGGEARAAARATAEQRRSDAENVLADVRGKSASLQARLEKEADEQAWAEVRRLFAARSRAMEEIDALCSKIGELYEPPKIDLRNAEAMRREMAAVYRDMRAKRIDVHDGTRLVYVLNALRQAYETDVLQKRLEKLESFYGTQHQKAP